VIARLRALDVAVTPQQAQESWALLTPYHEKAGYTAPRIVRDLRYNHVSTAGSLTIDEPALGIPLARFIDRHTASGA
jgi:hypothetical protein